MTEQEILEKTYETTLQKIYVQLFDVLVDSGSAIERKLAEKTFQSSVRKARNALDRAKQLLQDQD